MQTVERKTGQAWIWAIGINLVVFILLYMVLLKVPAPSQDKIATAKQPERTQPSEPGAGNTFGSITQHMGAPSTVAPEGNQGGNPTTGQKSGQWIGEFYLDLGPAISFSPRLNPDGTPRSIPSDQVYTKSPTYEDEDKTLTPENTNGPKMNPQMFSKIELPPELRNSNYQLTVQVWVDARGRVEGTPVVLKTSSNATVDKITIQKLMTNVTFTPATRKDTGQPVRIKVEIPIFWN
jgi:hypothetical protein